MDYIVENWFILVLAAAAIFVGAYNLFVFIKMPNNVQLAKVKEWLLIAVAQAEKELGSGTGKLKLRYVYDMFVGKFPSVAAVITFDAFSLLVDEVLQDFEHLLQTNEKVKEYVEK